MSLLRPQLAGRLIRPLSHGKCKGPIPMHGQARAVGNDASSTLISTDPANTSNKSTEMTASQSQPQGLINRQPDWTATVDAATSNFSPVPKRVMDGSEPGEITPAAVLSGAPIDLQARAVRIYRPTKPATQSGDWQGHTWRMDWDILQKGHRWENALMGWQSSGDFMQGTHLNFKTKEEAIHFAQKQGYEFFVQEPTVRKIRPKAYANNFLYSAKALKQISTK